MNKLIYWCILFRLSFFKRTGNDVWIYKSEIKDEIILFSPIISVALLAAVMVVVTFVGATIAANMIADMYKLAAAGYCKKWKNIPR